MRLNPMHIISALVNTEKIIYLILMYDFCEPQMTCSPSLVVSVSDHGTGGLGSIPGWAHNFAFLCRITSCRYYRIIKMTNIPTPLRFYIALSLWGGGGGGEAWCS